MGEGTGQDYSPNPAYVKLKNEMEIAKNILSRQQNQRLTVMLDRLLDSKGGLEKVFQDRSFESFKTSTSNTRAYNQRIYYMTI